MRTAKRGRGSSKLESSRLRRSGLRQALWRDMGYGVTGWLFVIRHGESVPLAAGLVKGTEVGGRSPRRLRPLAKRSEVRRQIAGGAFPARAFVVRGRRHGVNRQRFSCPP